MPLRRLEGAVRLERSLGLYLEPALWRWFAAHRPVSAVAGFLYIWGHLPATVGALVWVWLERPRRFALARDAFAATQLIVVAGYIAAPTPPPRALLGGVGHGGAAPPRPDPPPPPPPRRPPPPGGGPP